ncbi:MULTISPECIES: hypothetical protein [Streptomyces]|uniref:hypothetical protein n=1 Tax=Streptomyces TaxID=1883 RepID=UPI0008515D2C|nr:MULTISPECIES: hypothetical protein [unclassified Streptomyces]MDX3491040.1 hypothetical protein [Streptomyces sp. ID05-18]
MPHVLLVIAVLVPEVVLTCALLRRLPVRRERWVAAMPLPVTVVTALALRLVSEVSWPAALAACAGFLWGVLLALTPFRGWVSSWTLPLPGEARLRWSEAAIVVMGVLTPLSGGRTDAALEKAFATRRVIRARGPFPPLLGVALLVLPVVTAVGAGWAADHAGWA